MKNTIKKSSGLLQLLPFLLLVLTSIGLLTNIIEYESRSWSYMFHSSLVFLLLIIYTLITLIALSKEFPSFLNWVAILFLVLWGILAAPLERGETWKKNHSISIKEKEIKKIDRELAKNPSASLYIRKAEIQSYLFYKKRAIMDNYEKAFDLDPTSHTAFMHLVGFYRERPEKVEKLYLKISHACTQAQQLDPNNAELYRRGVYYYNELANLTHGSNHYQVALDNYNQYLKLRPNNFAHYYEKRAILHEYFQSYDKAISDYEFIIGGSCDRAQIDQKRIEQKIEELKALKKKDRSPSI